MAVSTRIIKRRIKSIKSTGKIMKAMELVAASKMRKATQHTLGTRSYANLILEMAQRLGEETQKELYPYLVGYGGSDSRNKNTNSTLLVLIASDRGLCGGFNGQMIKKALEFVGDRAGDNVRVITVGRRADSAIRRAGLELVASFESIANAPTFERTQPSANLILDEFTNKRANHVFLAYTSFKSALSQTPIVEKLLPILDASTVGDTQATTEEEGIDDQVSTESVSDIIFEPSADLILRQLLPRMIEMRIYQAFLESAASEHSARMMAMRSAGDAANEMQDMLTFTLNQARQASITREISEISAGKAALE